MSLGADATAYARRGWAVVPVHSVVHGRCSCGREDCPSPAKHPRVAWARFETEPASTAQVEAWWRRWPNANVGVLTGRVSGVVVLDVDPRNGGEASLGGVQERWGALPTTPEVLTGGGGRHLWFRAPESPVPSRAVAAGLDVKGDGGVVVVPPSVHASGSRYEWAPGRDPDAVPLGAAPAWFAEPAMEPVPVPGRIAALVRTEAERDEFARLWGTVGVVLAPGDRQYLCPFHPDHHPSLHVDADGCRWYCFGCRLGGGIARLRELLGVSVAPASRDRVTSTPDLPQPVDITLPGDEMIDAVGESLHQDALLGLTGGRRRYGGADVLTRAHLVPDPANPVDPLAIAVEINGRRVGWLARRDAERYRELVATTRTQHGEATCAARIRGGWDRGAGDVGRFGVVLLLPTPPGDSLLSPRRVPPRTTEPGQGRPRSADRD